MKMITRHSLHFLILNRKIRITLLISIFATALILSLPQYGSPQYYEGDKFTEYQTVEAILQKQQVVVDVDITRCFKGFSCQNLNQGRWQSKPRKINLFSSALSFYDYYLYVSYDKKIATPRFVVDVRTTSSKEPPLSKYPGSKWIHKLSAGVHVWINYLDVPDPSIPIIRDIDLLFGQEDLKEARPHWRFSQDVIKIPINQTIPPRLSLLEISSNEEFQVQKKTDAFYQDGVIVTVKPKFKILQINDLHIAHEASSCSAGECKFDATTLNFIKHTLEKEKDVQLVVITGDLIEASKIAHIESAVLKALSPILEARIPFIFTFGNSDVHLMSLESQINMLNFISSLPGCYNKQYAELDPKISGLTNGNVKVFYKPLTDKPGLSNKSQNNQVQLELPNALISYIDSKNSDIDATQSSFIYRTNAQVKEPVYHKLLFTHYPTPEFRPKGKFKLIGNYNEKHRLNVLTDKAILSDLKANNYKVMGVGHEHENDACIWNEEGKKILLCYGGVTGENAETVLEKNFKRRLRLFELDFEANKIMSWKRDIDKSSDRQLIWSLEEDGAESITSKEKVH